MDKEHQPHHDSRWALMRDVAVFQAKLFIDGIRDFALIPVSLVAGLIDLVEGNHPGHFRKVIEAGRRSERWINLFGQHGDDETASRSFTIRNARGGRDVRVPENLDAVVSKLEGLVVEQYRKGGMTASTKRVIDRSLDGLTGKSGQSADQGKDQDPGS